MKKKIAILGSTGSIGKSLFNILKKDKSKFEIVLLTANKNLNELIKQVKLFKVKNIIISHNETYLKAKRILKKKKIKIYKDYNNFNLIFKKKKIDYVMSSITGLEGLSPTLKIIKFCKTIAIANKESIICAWNLISKELKKNKTIFIPVDSEHFSIWSLISDMKDTNIEKIYITASGGPFNKLPLKKFSSINNTQALKHPNWSMGKKISIDSATMMNKVFEIIEAKKIFDLSYKKLEILVHPKSYVHAVVKFDNGLTKLLIHDTNMVIPIFNSLYPNHTKKINSKKLDFNIINNLNFKVIDIKRFPAVKMLKSLPSKDSLYETVIVTINDKLVNKFLRNEISFIEISKILLKVINFKEFKKYKSIKPRNVAQIEQLQDYVSLKIDSLSV